jgi:hypothetical protein
MHHFDAEAGAPHFEKTRGIRQISCLLMLYLVYHCINKYASGQRKIDPWALEPRAVFLEK